MRLFFPFQMAFIFTAFFRRGPILTTHDNLRLDPPSRTFWMFPKIGVPPNHPFLIRFSIIFTIHFGGNTTIFGNPLSFLGGNKPVWLAPKAFVSPLRPQGSRPCPIHFASHERSCLWRNSSGGIGHGKEDEIFPPKNPGPQKTPPVKKLG